MPNPALTQIKARIRNWSIPFLIKVSNENRSELWREAARDVLKERGISTPDSSSGVDTAKKQNKASHGAVIEQKQQPDWAVVIKEALEWVKRDPQPHPDPDFIPY